MNYIVFDMEFTVLRKRQHLADILEIGAIKLNDDDGVLGMVDLFHTYVQPVHYKTINAMTTQFTGITQEQVDAAPSFTEAMHQFQDWLGEAPYYLCAWGPDDKQQLVRGCREHMLKLDWIRNYNDIQLQYTRLQGGDQGGRLGLARALEAAQLPFFGSHHHALDDAFNTAKLFLRAFPQLQLEENNAADEQLYTSTVVYSTDSAADASDSPFARLAGLLDTAM
ncbi:3'-5' exonuclease [Paenibacillus sp. YYML68]|uniref:3'-5' exonuclease n=1 Tax=Paenibacillus sp. YYML68 TaxID=2909250 RepID=UPI00248F5D30|nr:3'-5' exonuclease [Paenibacillus sp. YYML68]